MSPARGRRRPALRRVFQPRVGPFDGGSGTPALAIVPQVEIPSGTTLRDLAPSAALTLAEAARVVGVAEAELAALVQSGALLSETARRAGKDVRVVRVVDLRDLFEEPPQGLAAEPAAERAIEPESEPVQPPPLAPPPAGAPPMGAPTPGAEPAASPRAAAVDGATVRGSNDVATLAPVLAELRARLDEAERERRASTAGLLLAQRRLLELEAVRGPVPLYRRAGLWTGLMAMSAIGALWFDLSGRLGAVRTATASAGERLSSTAQRLDEEVAGLDARLATLVEQSTGARNEAEAARRIAEARAAEEALQRRAELERATRERDALLARLDELRRDADAARAALGLEREASARERSRIDEQLAAAERELSRARAAVEDERRMAAQDRSAFLQRLEGLEGTARARELAAAEALAALARDTTSLRAATARAEDVASRLEASAQRNVEALARKEPPPPVAPPVAQPAPPPPRRHWLLEWLGVGR